MSSQYFLIKINAPPSGLHYSDLDGIREFIKESNDGASLICQGKKDVIVHCCSFRSELTMLATMNALRDDGVIERRVSQRRQTVGRRRFYEGSAGWDRRISSERRRKG